MNKKEDSTPKLQGLENLIEAAPTPIIHLASDASALKVNPQWSISTGQATEEAIEF